MKDNVLVRTVFNPEQWPIHDALSTDLHPDVPAFVPGKPFVLPGIQLLKKLLKARVWATDMLQNCYSKFVK